MRGEPCKSKPADQPPVIACSISPRLTSNRGDSRFTIVNEIAGVHLARSLFPQLLHFKGDAVLQLVEPGLYSKRRNR
jgi:hypothetical protein